MAMLGMPMLVLNLGGEMLYILDQVPLALAGRPHARLAARPAPLPPVP